MEAGIDVYTTLNVQHLESLNDVVAQITGVTVRETVPDWVFEQADEVELVDLAPDDLMERLREGKVYVPDQARRAIEHFFQKGNLIALRELALRETAERVDAQMTDYRRVHAIERTWPAAERLLVCVSPSPMSSRLVRATRRMAASLKAPWVAVHVETPADSRMSAADRERLANNLHLAEQLGGETATLSGHDVAEEVVTYARSRNVTKIIVGKPQQSRLQGAVSRLVCVRADSPLRRYRRVRDQRRLGGLGSAGRSGRPSNAAAIAVFVRVCWSWRCVRRSAG